MNSKKSNKITDIVRLQRLLKKWKNHAKASASNHTTITTTSASSGNGSAGKTINKFLKRTLSFTDIVSSSSSTSSASQNDAVPKGFLAVDCVNAHELKRFVIPTEYLGHRVFGVLLREAEEEFGFQQEGVLKIPCEVAVFERILKVVEGKVSSLDEDVMFLHELGFDVMESHEMMSCSSSTSPDCEQLTRSHNAQMCR